MTSDRRPAWTGAVLTGGASRRMGRDKALIEVGGRALARIAADALTGAGAAEVFAVGGDRGGLEALGIGVVADVHPGEGPLGGLLTAFGATRTEVVVALACDLPGATSAGVVAVLDALLAAPTAAVAWPEAPRRIHVLHAAWRVPIAGPVLADAFAGGERSPRRAAAMLQQVVVTTIPPAGLHNANVPGDIDAHRDR